MRQVEDNSVPVSSYALLETDRGSLSEEAVQMLDALEKLTPEDYRWAAELSVREIVRSMSRYADPVRYRAEIEASAARAS